jgi:hypothetical protein
MTRWLFREYGFRYGKKHKCSDVLDMVFNDIYRHLAASDYSCDFTTPALAMPDDCKTGDPVQSYRDYYLKYKSHLLTYTRREIPEWIKAAGLGKWKEGKVK